MVALAHARINKEGFWIQGKITLIFKGEAM